MKAQTQIFLLYIERLVLRVLQIYILDIYNTSMDVRSICEIIYAYLRKTIHLKILLQTVSKHLTELHMSLTLSLK